MGWSALARGLSIFTWDDEDASIDGKDDDDVFGVILLWGDDDDDENFKGVLLRGEEGRVGGVSKGEATSISQMVTIW